jgi:hypothetical protein
VSARASLLAAVVAAAVVALAACAGGERPRADSIAADSARDTAGPAIAPAPIPPSSQREQDSSAGASKTAVRGSDSVQGRDSARGLLPGDPRRKALTVPTDTVRRP